MSLIKRNKKHWLIFSVILALSLLLLWVLNYCSVVSDIPWPGGEGGLDRMRQSYFIKNRNEFYIQQSLILSVFLIISLGLCELIWIKRKELIDKVVLGLMIWVTISIFSIIFLSFFAVLPLGLGAILSLSAIVWGILVKRWKFPLLPFFYSIMLAVYSIHHFSEWFAIYGD